MSTDFNVFAAIEQMNLDRLSDIMLENVNIYGYLSIWDSIILYNLCMYAHPNGRVVEIGSFKGKSTHILASAARDNNGMQIFAIDPHRGNKEHKDGNYKEDIPTGSTYEDFSYNMTKFGLDGWMIPMICTSEEAAENFNLPVSLLFVDGSHEYEDVKKDIELWYPKLIKGGVVAMHDTSGAWPGPEKVCKEMKESGLFDSFVRVGSMTLMKKV